MSMEAEASNQVITMTLEGIKISIMLGGKAAAFGMAVFKSYYENRISQKALTPGEQRLEHMMRSGRELNQFLIPSERYNEFADNARKRGITFSATRFPDEDVCCVTIYQQDAARINRLIEDIGIGDIDNVDITTEHDTVANEKDSTTQRTDDQEKSSEEDDYTASERAEQSVDENGEYISKMDDSDIDELYRNISPIESEGTIPFTRAAREQEALLKNSSPHSRVEVVSESEKSETSLEFEYTELSNISDENNKATVALREGVSMNDPSNRPSVRKRMNEIIQSQLADKAEKSLEKSATEVVREIKQVAENLKQ